MFPHINDLLRPVKNTLPLANIEDGEAVAERRLESFGKSMIFRFNWQLLKATHFFDSVPLITVNA